MQDFFYNPLTSGSLAVFNGPIHDPEMERLIRERDLLRAECLAARSHELADHSFRNANGSTIVVARERMIKTEAALEAARDAVDAAEVLL